jgi:hypothetical protein
MHPKNVVLSEYVECGAGRLIKLDRLASRKTVKMTNAASNASTVSS